MAVEDQRADKTMRKILVGAMNALSRQGTHKLSVSDICESSGVARGTFYRYFSSREDVLVALREHFKEGVAESLATAIKCQPDPAVRVQVVLDTIIDPRAAGGDWNQLFEVAPAFTLAFIRDTFPNLVDVLAEALGPAANESPLVTGGMLTERQLADLFLRSVMSMVFLPGNRSDEVPALILSLFKNRPTREDEPRRRSRSKAS